MKIRKMHNKNIHRHERKSLSSFQSNYNRITIGLQPVESSPTSRKRTVQAVPSKKKGEREKEAKDKGERHNEEKESEMEISGKGENERKEENEKLEKKKKGWKRRRRRREKREEERVKREEERKRREEEREKRGGRRKIRNRESSAEDAPPSPGAFPSQKLGNNMTPRKGRLGKNTTLTGRDPEKLIQKLQRNPSEDSRASNIHPIRTSFTYHERHNLQKHRIQKQHNHHLLEGQSTRESAQTFQILHKSALKTLAFFQELQVNQQHGAFQYTKLFNYQGHSARSPVAHFDELIYSTQATLPQESDQLRLHRHSA